MSTMGREYVDSWCLSTSLEKVYFKDDPIVNSAYRLD